MDLTPLLQAVPPAAVVGAVALWRSHRMDRRSTLLKLTEQLIDPKMQEGRRLLHAYAEQGTEWWLARDPQDPGHGDVDKINAALALFDIAGWYVERGYIDKEALLELWARAVVVCWDRAQPYVQMRRSREDWRGWAKFEFLAHEARIHIAQSKASGA